MSKHSHRNSSDGYPDAESENAETDKSDGGRGENSGAQRSEAQDFAADLASKDPADLAKALADKEKELAELKDKYLRALADGENARKRIRQQSEESVRIQRENWLRDLLPIVDNLERALAAARTSGATAKAISEGIEMVLRSLLDLLKAQGVTQIESVGQSFDPVRHEAVDHVASAEHPANAVVEEFHHGYQIGDRILRPARVSVAKGTRSEERSEGENDGSDVENR